MRSLLLVILLGACADDTGSGGPIDMAVRSYPKEGQPCGGDGGPVDPNACGPDYVCMVVGTLPPACLVLSGKGGACGGNTSRPRQCEPGLTCKPSGVPDTGGSCQ
jgi:hypothetical protein